MWFNKRPIVMRPTFVIFLTISLSLSSRGLLAVNTPGLLSLLNLDWAALVLALAGDLEDSSDSDRRTRLGQCCRA